MSWIKKLIEEEAERSPEFKAAYQEEAIRIALVKARNEAGLSQRDLAEKLGVSQPRIAQVERGSRPMSMKFLLAYASAVNARIEVQLGSDVA